MNTLFWSGNKIPGVFSKKGKLFMEKGTIFKFHNDLDTDQIIASQYLLLPNLDEMKSHTFESLDPDFSKKVKAGDFVIGGENFGCGSSREQGRCRCRSGGTGGTPG